MNNVNKIENKWAYIPLIVKVMSICVDRHFVSNTKEIEKEKVKIIKMNNSKDDISEYIVCSEKYHSPFVMDNIAFELNAMHYSIGRG